MKITKTEDGSDNICMDNANNKMDKEQILRQIEDQVEWMEDRKAQVARASAALKAVKNETNRLILQMEKKALVMAKRQYKKLWKQYGKAKF